MFLSLIIGRHFLFGLRPDTGLKKNSYKNALFIDIITSKDWLLLLWKISPPQKIIFFMVAILNNKMASTDRDYSPFYNSVFSVMAEDRPSILFVSCTVTSIECNVTR